MYCLISIAGLELPYLSFQGLCQTSWAVLAWSLATVMPTYSGSWRLVPWSLGIGTNSVAAQQRSNFSHFLAQHVHFHRKILQSRAQGPVGLRNMRGPFWSLLPKLCSAELLISAAMHSIASNLAPDAVW